MAQIWDDEEPTRDTVQTIIGMVAVYYAHVGAYNNAVLAQRLTPVEGEQAKRTARMRLELYIARKLQEYRRRGRSRPHG